MSSRPLRGYPPSNTNGHSHHSTSSYPATRPPYRPHVTNGLDSPDQTLSPPPPSHTIPMTRRTRTPSSDQSSSSSSSSHHHLTLPNDISLSSSSSSRRKTSPSPSHRSLAPSPLPTDSDSDDDNARGLSKTPSLTHPLPLFSSLIRSPTLLSAAKIIITLLLLLLSFRFAFHLYLDRLKSSDYTIVAVMRDFSYQSAESDKMRHAFQYSALQSWSELVVGRNLVVFGDTPETCDYVSDIVRDVRCELITCWHEESRKPLLSCIMSTIVASVTTPTVVYVNADVVIHPSLTSAVEMVKGKYEKYLMVGSRVSVEAQIGTLDSYQSSTFLPQLFTHAAAKGQRVASATHTADVFVFPLSLLSSPSFTPFPPFLAGVYRWDQWFVSSCILDDSITVIDLSPSVPLIFQQKTQPSPPSKQGTAYNDQLVKTLSGNSYKIGYTDNAEQVLVGQCPSCELIINTNITDVVLFTKRASKEGYLVVLTVNSGYTNLALNWVCWAKRIHFMNYILIAEDQLSASKFRSHGCPVIVRKDAPAEKPAADYGSVEFQETMTFRTEFLMSVLQAGFHFVTADMDGLWLDDPIQYFNHNVDLQGQTHKETKISGGFVVVRATSYGRYFWQQVIECQRKNAIFLSTAKPGTYEPASYTEQYCVNELSHGLSSQPLFSKGLLDPYIFPDGKSFFDEKQSQYRGIMPAVIHNNWIKGTIPKLNRLHDWHLHSADEEKEICIEIPSLPPPTLSFPGPRLTIRVMGGKSAPHLLTLLQSLAKGEYEGDQVGLVIALDGGRGGGAEVKKVADSFDWQYGDKRVEEEGGGKLKLWTAWKATGDDEVVLFIEEDAQLSTGWYRAVRELLSAYYADGPQYDHRVYGIALTRPNIIIGETYDQRWGSTIPSDRLPPFSSSPLYKYQLLSQSAVIMFPHHWRQFLDWMQGKDKGDLPCTPTLITNTWLTEDKDQHWAALFHRFTFEQGWYAIYINPPDSQSLAIASNEYLQERLTPKHKTSQAVLLTGNVSTVLIGGGGGMGNWPVRDSIPVYDFHFKLVNVVDTLSWRQYLTLPQYFPDQCWVMEKMEAKLREDAERVEREKVEKIKKQMEKQKEAEAAKKAKADEEKKKKEAAKAATKPSNATAPHPPSTNATKAAKAPAKPTNSTKQAAAKKGEKKETAKRKSAAAPAAPPAPATPATPEPAAPPAVTSPAVEAPAAAAAAAPAESPAAGDAGRQ